MRFQKNLLRIMILVSIIATIASAIFTYMQIKYIERPIYSIINNISICILTGGIIAIVQSAITYHNVKKGVILEFYRQVIKMEEKIVNYPYMSEGGFQEAHKAILKIQSITNQFNNEFKWAYFEVDKSNKRNYIIKNIINLYNSYRVQIETFYKMETNLINAIRYTDEDEEKLIHKGINITLETQRYNDILQKCEQNIENMYNDEVMRKMNNKCLDEIEIYLFKFSRNNKNI